MNGSPAAAERILLVEDDESLGRQVVASLRGAAFDPTWVTNGDEALKLPPDHYALVILDLMLPGAHGLDVLKHFRGGSDVPVMILSARNDTSDKVRAFGIGADDYVTKPFWPEELLARVKARVRRPALVRSAVIQAGVLRIDLAAREVTVSGRRTELTKVEFDLLAALAKRPGEAITRATLVGAALDRAREGTERTLDVHMSRLRKKLGEGGARLATVWGVGYRLETREPE